MDKPLVSVVAPVFNEQGALQDLVNRILTAALPLRGHYDFEILLVDDGSRDGSWPIISELARAHPGVRGLRFTRNFGHQAALLAGLSAARGAAVITLDSDGQHPPEMIPEMLAKWREGALIVQGLRTAAADQGPLKSWTSRAFYRIFSWLAGVQIPRGSADFRLLDRRAVDLLLEHPNAALFLRGFAPWTGFRTEYFSFEARARRSGVSKYSPLRMIGLARQGILRFSVAPLRLATLLGGGTCLLALAYMVYVVLIRLLTGSAVAGWASVAGLLGLLGGVQLLVIGILGEYVGMIFEMQLGRPHYIVAQKAEAAPADRPAEGPR